MLFYLVVGLDPTKPILQCDACGYQANRRDYMRRHQIRVHSDYRPYQCNMCDFKTTEKHDLDRHLASKYHGGKGISQKVRSNNLSGTWLVGDHG